MRVSLQTRRVAFREGLELMGPNQATPHFGQMGVRAGAQKSRSYQFFVQSPEQEQGPLRAPHSARMLYDPPCLHKDTHV